MNLVGIKNVIVRKDLVQFKIFSEMKIEWI
jgi:hypothetical protein